MHIPNYARELPNVCATKAGLPRPGQRDSGGLQIPPIPPSPSPSTFSLKGFPGVACAAQGPGILEAGGPTYFTSASSDAAFRSAGAGIQLIDMVVASAKARKASGGGAGAAGFGACRPPGAKAIRGKSNLNPCPSRHLHPIQCVGANARQRPSRWVMRISLRCLQGTMQFQRGRWASASLTTCLSWRDMPR